MEFAAIKKNGALYPLDGIQEEEFLKHIPEGIPIAIVYDDKRNAANHRRFFVFLETAFGMQEHFENREVFRKYIQMKAGHYDAVVSPKGKTFYIPRSIKWSKLPEAKFKKLFSECVSAFLNFYNEFSSRQLTEEEFRRICDFD